MAFHVKTKSWWRDRFITLMVIPERTRRVHRVAIPFVLLKVGAVFLSLGFFFLLIIGFDYLHLLGRLAENKRLKGENFKLRQEIQVIRNKVDSMETTIERVRNYAKKLQILTGQGGNLAGELPKGPLLDEELDRSPAGVNKNRGSFLPPEVPNTAVGKNALNDRIENLQSVSLTTETYLSRLQSYLHTRSAVLQATPSLIPIAGWISSVFGYRRHPYDGSYRFHSGVDLAAEPGTPVRTPAEGTVIFAGHRQGYGKVVVIDHGYGIHTLFAHNSRLFVSSGVRVKRGEVISQVGSTGHATGPHLHYEVRKNGVPVNPVTFFSRARF